VQNGGGFVRIDRRSISVSSARAVKAEPNRGRAISFRVNMIPIILSIVAFCVLVAEFWTGIAVVGWSGDKMVIERRKSPGPYWFTMAIHTVIGVGIALLSLLAT
jgi:hypothetical protein